MSHIREPADDAVLMERALRWTEGFASWPERSMKALLFTARLGRFGRGELIWTDSADEPCTQVIVAGHVMVRRVKADGSKSMLGLLGPGRVVGLTRAVDIQDDSDFEAVAHSDALVIELNSRTLLGQLDAEPTLWPHMARMLMRQQREALNSLLDRVTGGLSERLAATVDRLATLHGVSETSGQSLRLRLSQEDLASMLQVSRQTINKELRALQQAGVIASDYKSLTIHDRGALRKAAGKRAAID